MVDPLVGSHHPTREGDTFAGHPAGCFAATVTRLRPSDLRKATIYPSALASLCVEAFSLERLRKLAMEKIAKRYETFKLMSQFELPA
ncbi:MAG: hypothetical protein DME54_05925 [Verrucomicrobia bacterium]|nr:MAG: hypothetical protein DME62_00770 [Verrucomicrobiota bacterium]PYK35090.1 MAG: hypothetical protein DME54_05925 [Verrucomicrobiota bacterium]